MPGVTAAPRQNRVTPLGELIRDPARGLVFGNRGCLHDDLGRIRRNHRGRRWIACRLEFRGWHREPLMAPGRYTELFFLDDSTALAAGHRPCALCRRDDYDRLVAVLGGLHPGMSGADAIDAQLHRERIDPMTGRQSRHDVELNEVPDGAFVADGDTPWLVWGEELLEWSPAGYRHRRRRPAGVRALALTPPSLRAVLRAGWSPVVPLVHPSALAAG
jgi:hypothetical protein